MQFSGQAKLFASTVVPRRLESCSRGASHEDCRDVHEPSCVWLCVKASPGNRWHVIPVARSPCDAVLPALAVDGIAGAASPRRGRVCKGVECSGHINVPLAHLRHRLCHGGSVAAVRALEHDGAQPKVVAPQGRALSCVKSGRDPAAHSIGDASLVRHRGALRGAWGVLKHWGCRL